MKHFPSRQCNVMLIICRTPSVRGYVLVSSQVHCKGFLTHREANKRRPWTTQHVPSTLKYNRHSLATHTSHDTSPTLFTSLSEPVPIQDINHSTPIQYAPDSPPPSSYHIPPAILQDANQKGTFWSYNMYKNLTTGKPPLRHYCKTKEQTETVAKLFLEDGAKHLGFDMEWAPAGRTYINEGPRVKASVSMIQLASESRIAIFHLALYPETTALTLLPPSSSLAHLLTTPSITKLGVAISADMTRLHKHFPHIAPRSHFELSHLYKTILYPSSSASFNRKTVALAEQALSIFGLPLSKDQDIRGSDWSRPVSLQQVDYAASDAYVGLMLFCEMDRRRRSMVPGVRMPAFAEYGCALGEWPGERKAKVRKPVEKVKGEGLPASEEAAAEEEIEEETEEEEEGNGIVVDEQHDAKSVGGEEMEEEFTDAGDEFDEQTTTKPRKTKVFAEQAAKEKVRQTQKSMIKPERTAEEKAAALARRNAFLQNMYQQKLRK